MLLMGDHIPVGPTIKILFPPNFCGIPEDQSQHTGWKLLPYINHMRALYSTVIPTVPWWVCSGILGQWPSKHTALENNHLICCQLIRKLKQLLTRRISCSQFQAHLPAKHWLDEECLDVKKSFAKKDYIVDLWHLQWPKSFKSERSILILPCLCQRVQPQRQPRLFF